MKIKHPHVCVWTGHDWLPTLHFARLAESTFTSGEAYRLGVLEEKENERLRTRRTKEQNDKMWAMLAEFAEQAQHPYAVRNFSDDEWKVLLMHAMGQDLRLLPSLDGQTVVPYGSRSSHMTIAQMTEFIEFMYAKGTEYGVKFSDQEGITWQR
jgi:hypothetical protein